MGRESSHGTKELFNLHVPPLVLKARHQDGSAVISRCAWCLCRHWDGFPLGLGLFVEDKPTELSCTNFKHIGTKSHSLHIYTQGILHSYTSHSPSSP